MELHDKIDRYLLNQMSPADKAKFEELMASDSLLKNEMLLQQSIVAALGDTRALQLKTRLQKIPVSMSSTSQALRLKWLGMAATGMIAAGLIVYLFLGQEQVMPEQAVVSTSPQVEQVQQNGNAVTTNASSSKDAANNQEQQVTSTVKTTSKNPVVKNPEIKAFDADALADSENDNTLSSPSLDEHTVPVNSLYNESNTKLSNLSVSVDNSNLKDKSYQFSGAKLTLFGDFNNKPYELLELNNKGQKTLFLSYDNAYYELVWGQTKKTPLKKVSSKDTLDKLKLINP